MAINLNDFKALTNFAWMSQASYLDKLRGQVLQSNILSSEHAHG